MGQEQLIKEMVLSRVTNCEQCGVQYDLPDVNVLGHKEDIWFLMLVCAQCHQAVGIAAMVSERTAESAGQRFDASKQPIVGQAAIPSQPVTTEDVAGVRDFLSGFDGDFQKLFRKN